MRRRLPPSRGRRRQILLVFTRPETDEICGREEAGELSLRAAGGGGEGGRALG